MQLIKTSICQSASVFILQNKAAPPAEHDGIMHTLLIDFITLF